MAGYVSDDKTDANYDPDEHLRAIWRMLHCLNTVRDIRDADITAKLSTLNDDFDEELNSDLGHFYVHQMYEDTAYSHTAAAALAALFEGAFRHEFGVMHEYDLKKPVTKKATRRDGLPTDDFWNPAVVASKNGTKKEQGDIVVGSVQILEAIDLLGAFPARFSLVIELLFYYRNNTMHNGYEWIVGRREKFLRHIETRGATVWFETAMYGENPWTIVMTDEFVQLCFDVANETIPVLKSRVSEYRYRHKPKRRIPRLIGPSRKPDPRLVTAMINMIYDPKIYKPL